MADYVLVHGGNMTTDTWNRLTRGPAVHTPDGTMGGRIWEPVITALVHHGHRVFAPTLEDEHSHDLGDHIGQVCSVIAENSLRDVILVAHRYGGMVITGVAARVPGSISAMVYIDAALPDPGQSLFDIISSGGIDPRSFAGLEPALPYVEKLQFDVRVLDRVRKTYVRCTESDFSPVTRLVRQEIAGRSGWTYRELATSHVPMAEMPDELARILLAA